MTQAVLATSIPVAATAAPVGPAASEAGEPTLEEIAASMAEPVAEVVVEPIVTEEPATEAATEPVAATEPAEADAALERATKAAARAREGSRRYAETQRQLQESAQRTQHAAREAEQLRQENAQAKQREAAYKQDPYKALKDAGMTDHQLAERAMRENSPEATLLRLQEQVEQERTARQALEQRLVSEREAVRAAEAQQRMESAFVAVADDEATYPRLAQLNSGAQLTVAQAALKQIRSNGYNTNGMSNAQVAEACEIYLAPKKGAKTTAAAPAVAKPVAKMSGKTLTNAQAQTRTVAPAAWDTLSEDQQLAHIAASLPEPT